ncbi:hypothetical protein [Ottowia sp.]|uniref:hypothetical protein n=1 Tax=Ottowia sp. TaxID=1898956 RepID=UPI003A873937
MSYPPLPPPNTSGSGGGLERFFARLFSRLMGLMLWITLGLIGLVFAFSLLVWLLVMLVASLVSSVFTGRKPAVAVLWSRYRDMTRQRWPQRPDFGQPASSTPRADAADATGAATDTGVQDVRWREVRADPPADSPVDQSADSAASSAPPPPRQS